MTQQECYKLLLKAYPNKVARKCVYHNGYFIFLLVPKDNTSALVIDQFYAVNKETGNIGAYQPTNDKNADEFFKLWKKGKDSFTGFKVKGLKE